MEIIIRAKHPLWIRWTHWVNFPILTLMVISGFQIKWANAEDYMSWVPNGVWSALGFDHKLALGLAIHFTLMWIFIINGFLYCGYMIISGEWRELFPKRESIRGAFQVLLHDLRIRREPLPPGKFNHAQRIAYTSVILLAVIAVLSGFAIYKPIQLPVLREMFLGYQSARLIHLIIAVSFILFFIVHIAQVVRAGWNNFQSMVTGDEVENENGKN